MAPPRATERTRYRHRIRHLVRNPPTSAEGPGSELEVQAHWAKYSCVLISGFIEQAIKEIFLEYASTAASPQVRKYVEGTWPNQRNMRCAVIKEFLGYFDDSWKADFEEWLKDSERKKEINEIIAWRNNIVHGNEANTNNVTLVSVNEKFQVACDLVKFIEEKLSPAKTA